ncbi:unnamed protein product [Durusdinium trenchii]|uniref:Uncharacterized protein n=1 Tax=Durusdinium trenchii TaxID=1381693 RepID=A0ABP0SJ61_9DINO
MAMLRATVSLFALTPVLAQFSTATQKPSQDMLSMMCDTVPVPGLCKQSPGQSSGTGLNSLECKKNPSACCTAAVKKCSSTDPFSVFAGGVCPKSMGKSQCVGSEMLSPTMVGVCMCTDPGTICSGSGDSPVCTSSASAITAAATKSAVAAGFSRLYEEEPAEEVLNIGGWVSAAAIAGTFALVLMVMIRGLRHLFRSTTQAHQPLVQDSQDEEAFNE